MKLYSMVKMALYDDNLGLPAWSCEYTAGLRMVVLNTSRVCAARCALRYCTAGSHHTGLVQKWRQKI